MSITQELTSLTKINHGLNPKKNIFFLLLNKKKHGYCCKTKVKPWFCQEELMYKKTLLQQFYHKKTGFIFVKTKGFNMFLIQLAKSILYIIIVQNSELINHNFTIHRHI